uniref:Acidic protein n=1 Tax=Oryza meridionalis TaxID=40149 RepID=A0A0E0EDR4_9ORYZ
MAATTTGRVVALGAVAVVVALIFLAGGADADCYDYCFKDCMARENNMVDYCSYACDKTCQPDKPTLYSSSSTRPLAAAGDMECQLSCALGSCHRLLPEGKGAVEACFGQCYDGCKTTAAAMLPRPLRAGHHVLSSPPDDVEHDPDQVFASPPDDVDRHVFAAPPDVLAALPGEPDHA